VRFRALFSLNRNGAATFMKSTELAAGLVSLGCPETKSVEMAGQLEKRARQLAEQGNRSYDEAMAYLLELMKQGWAAKARGL